MRSFCFPEKVKVRRVKVRLGWDSLTSQGKWKSIKMRKCKDTIKKETMRSPTQLPTQGQWWSNLSTQLSHMEQWEALGGRKILHVKQYFSFTDCPFTWNVGNFVRKERWFFSQFKLPQLQNYIGDQKYMNFVNNILHLLFLCNLTTKSRSRALSYLGISLSSNRSRTLQ